MSRMQLFAFILQTQVGIGVLSFPNVLHESAGVDGWMSVILAGAVVQLILLVYIALCKRYPGYNLYTMMPEIFGKWLGNAVNAIYLIHFIFISCVILLLEMVFVELWVLPFTDPWMILTANCLVFLYFAGESLRIIARYQVMVSLLLVVMIALLLTSFQTMDYRYMLPIGQQGLMAIMAGVKSSIISFLGFELFLVVASDVQTEGKSMIAPVLWANGMATVFFLVVVVLIFLNFSPESLSFIPQPVPYFLNGIALPFLERMDLIFLSVWLVKVTATLISYLFAAGKGLGYWFHRNEHKRSIYYLAPAICLAGMLWRSEERILWLQKIVEYESYVVIGLPMLIFLYVWMRGKKGRPAV
ncbi:GerAB/ArcD/ProY family transporter [Paenibacillus sp. GCM10023248]|uniref:GerAB/ArcD/ProY family transporter n=1 Tax=unclassified Paenibacillus TaxID=185978 RepID=UPI002379D3BB|nr:GerAB/ArcD/ProY family transporter [Paenibacillus sp. MAHUQ-63]MDD9266870.1 GerAB/ArcD/ProY family transporter [Paenibacillus sp. MAHUQ-63]